MDRNAILDAYIDQLLERSTPEAPVWNIERIRAGKPASWNYIDGCMLKALIELHDITGRADYLEFADAFVDAFVSDDGSIRRYDPAEHNLDNVNAGKTLFRLFELTGKEKYRRAMDVVRSQLDGQPRTREGSFWHKAVYPNQVWLDGLYMAQPFYLQYELAFRAGAGVSDSIHQFEVVRERLRDPKNGLYYHAYDESRRQFWCDPVTGLSSSFWLRAEGWFAMALVDAWEILPPERAAERDVLGSMFRELVDAMLPYQDVETGMWHQVINLPGIEPNYLEESGSAIFANAIMKGARLGVLEASLWQVGRRAFDGVCARCLSEKDGELALEDICLVAGLGNKQQRDGTFGYYMSEPVVANDAKGVAPLVLAYIETLRGGELAELDVADPFGGYARPLA